MKDPDVRPKRVCSPRYAVLKAKKGKKLNRWEIEELAKDADLSLKYAKITKARFPEGEPAIALRTGLALEYAKDIIDGRFPEAEETLLKTLENHYGGATIVRHYFITHEVRNERVEKYILSKDSSLISEYANACIKDRWAEAEKVLLKGRLDNAVEYQAAVIKGRWPELEDKIIRGKNVSYWDDPRTCFKNYINNIGGRHEGVEEKLKKTNRASLILTYALTTKSRLPSELHQKMMMFSFDPKRQNSAKKYLKFLESCEKRAVRYLSGLDEDELKEVLAKARTK